MKLTKERAKKLSLEVWEYLRDHPEIEDKIYLPQDLLAKIDHMWSLCPLCEYKEKNKLSCNDCPLFRCGFGSLYNKWCRATSNKSRKTYASQIVEKIKAW